jgi:hypothetical protein
MLVLLFALQFLIHVEFLRCQMPLSVHSNITLFQRVSSHSLLLIHMILHQLTSPLLPTPPQLHPIRPRLINTSMPYHENGHLLHFLPLIIQTPKSERSALARSVEMSHAVAEKR